MAAATVKIPLSVKKDIKDAEPKKVEYLARIEKALGYPVTFEYDLNALFASQEGRDTQLHVGRWMVDNYLKNLAACIETGAKDSLVKDGFTKKFAKKNINYFIIPDDYNCDTNPDGGVMGYSNSCGLRMLDGECQIIFKKRSFGDGQDINEGLKLATVIAKSKAAEGAAEELPTDVQVAVRDRDKERVAAIAKIEKVMGVTGVTWDVEADLMAIHKAGAELPQAAFNYITALAVALETQCKEEMLREAITDVWTKKKLGVKIVADDAAVRAMPMTSAGSDPTVYNGIQIDNGEINVVVPLKRWRTAISDVEHDHKLIKLF